MRTLHFVENYLQLTETFIYNYISKSAESGEVVVVAFDILNEDHFPLPSGVTLRKIKKDPSFSRKDWSRLHWLIIRKFFRKRIWYGELKKIINHFKPQIIHCHFGTTGIYFTDFKKSEQVDIPYLTNFYGYDASELPLRDPVYAGGLQRLWKEGNAILAEGPAMGKRLEALGASDEKIRISPIIIDGRKYPKRDITAYQRSTPVSFLLIGRFVEKKGFHLFLEAIGSLKNEIAGFKIIMIGSGPLEERYKSIINKYGIQDLVFFEGMKSLKECMNYLVAADVLVQSSVTASNGDSEGGAPTILIEAQLIGTPIIASTHADIPYVMGYDDFLVKEGDIADLAVHIKRFMSSSELQKVLETGRERTQKNHDMNFSSIYPEILSEFSA